MISSQQQRQVLIQSQSISQTQNDLFIIYNNTRDISNCPVNFLESL